MILWFVGVVGMLFVQFSSESNGLVLETVKHPSSLLFSAILLTFMVPALSIGHFLSLLSAETANILSFFTSLSYIYFVVRKFSSPVVNDLGDKSIFEFLDKQTP
ncbi:hypothetical protein Gasu2_54630 [Galdieria sulphuraria]|nr:hypothetical protein Gasu2_54630 [Galdieria sulphuraria]